MNRRNFLKGVLASTTATTALVTLATPQETQALAVGSEVFVSKPDKQQFPDLRIPELYARNEKGDFICIGYMTQISYQCSQVENLHWSGSGLIVPGLRKSNVYFEGGK